MKRAFQNCKGLQNRGINLHVCLHAPLTVMAQGWAISQSKLLGALRSQPACHAGDIQAWKTAPESRIAWASSGVAGQNFCSAGTQSKATGRTLVAAKQTYGIRWNSADTCTFGYFSAKYCIITQTLRASAEFAQKQTFFQRKNGVFLVKNGQTEYWYCPKQIPAFPQICSFSEQVQSKNIRFACFLSSH